MTICTLMWIWHTWSFRNEACRVQNSVNGSGGVDDALLEVLVVALKLLLLFVGLCNGCLGVGYANLWFRCLLLNHGWLHKVRTREVSMRRFR